MHRAYRQTTRLFGSLVCLLGIAIVVSTIARGGGPLAVGVIVGVGLAVFGAGRVYMASER